MENNHTTRVNASLAASRRDFFKDTARKAAWVAPTLTLLMAASATPARAQHTSGQHDHKKCVGGFRFWQLWYRVHRGR